MSNPIPIVSDLDRAIAALQTAVEALIEFKAEDATHLAGVLDSLKAAQPGNLVLEAGSDPSAYVLREGTEESGAWIRIKNIDVRVYQTDEGVCVDLYPANSPDTEAQASTWLTFAEAAEDE
jgi:hypothetical protein